MLKDMKLKTKPDNKYFIKIISYEKCKRDDCKDGLVIENSWEDEYGSYHKYDEPKITYCWNCKGTTFAPVCEEIAAIPIVGTAYDTVIYKRDPKYVNLSEKKHELSKLIERQKILEEEIKNLKENLNEKS